MIPKKLISIFPNNKPSVSKSVKTTSIQRNITFNQGDDIHYRELQMQAKKELKLAKLTYKDKVQSLLSTGNSRPAWVGVKSKKCPISLAGKTDSELANDIFKNRFNTCGFSKELSVYINACPDQKEIHIDRDKVFKPFRGVKERKSLSPDDIGGRLLKECAEPSDIFSITP